MIYENVVDLVEDAEIFSIDPEDWEILGEAITVGGKEYLTGKYAGAAVGNVTNSIQAGAKDFGTKLGNVTNKAAEKLGSDDLGRISKSMLDNPQTTAWAALGTAVIALAGAYALGKYLNSIWRLQKLVPYYEKKAKEAKNPAQKAKFTAKATKYSARLKMAQAKARTAKTKFIEQTKSMQNTYTDMKKSKTSDPKALEKLSKKLDARNKVMSKIGAI
jgi:hypothetical protein